MPSNLRDAINRSPNAADLSALGANDTYSRRVNEELALREDAAKKAELLAAKNEDLLSVVNLFSNAVTATRAVMTRQCRPSSLVPAPQRVLPAGLSLPCNRQASRALHRLRPCPRAVQSQADASAALANPRCPAIQNRCRFRAHHAGDRVPLRIRSTTKDKALRCLG